MNIGVDNGDVNGGHYYMNSYTGYESKNQNLIDYTKKIDEFSTNIYWRENNGLPDGVDIDDMPPLFVLNQYTNM